MQPLLRNQDGRLSVNSKIKIFGWFSVGGGLGLMVIFLLHWFFPGSWWLLALGILMLLFAVHATVMYATIGYVVTKGAWAHGKWAWIYYLINLMLALGICGAVIFAFFKSG